MGWFHVADGLFFRRSDDGAVQIGRGKSFDSVEIIQTMDASSWGSVVSSVCARGENYETYNAALIFHQEAP